MKKPRILVHICCAPDALYSVYLLKKNYEVTGFFYNPNIHPRPEYKLRLKEMEKVARILDFKLLTGDYDGQRWLRLTRKFRSEPERGRRCDICYALRLERTAQKAAELGLDSFTTVMSISPWKKAQSMNRIGKMFGNRYLVRFLEENFKKKDGFKKSVGLSQAHGLYRQSYCGCLYSIPSGKNGNKDKKQTS